MSRGTWKSTASAGLLVGLSILAVANAALAQPGPAPDPNEGLRESVERLEARIVELEQGALEQREDLRAADQELEALRQELDAAKQGLDAAEVRLADQSSMIRAISTGSQEIGSSLSRFLERVDFSGAVATSYNFNFNNPDSTPNAGFPNGFGPGDNRPVYPQVKHNTFQIDQVRFAVAKDATDDERAGFRVESLYGVSADPSGGSDNPILQQAFVSYRVPFGREIEVRMGRWDTPIGAETIYVGENWNISRGLLWSFQPLNHDGILLRGGLPMGFAWKAGVANNSGAVNFDNNNAKTGLFQIGWENHDASRQIRLTYMAEDGPLRGPFASNSNGRDSDISHMLDLVAFWDPSDRLSLWLNVDWIHTDFRRQDESDVFGIALAGRLGFTDKTGASLRAEWAGLRPGQEMGNDIEAIWLTGTVDHALTSQLSLRAEIAWYMALRDGGPDNFFINGAGTARTKRQQTVAIVQAIYFF